MRGVWAPAGLGTSSTRSSEVMWHAAAWRTLERVAADEVDGAVGRAGTGVAFGGGGASSILPLTLPQSGPRMEPVFHLTERRAKCESLAWRANH